MVDSKQLQILCGTSFLLTVTGDSVKLRGFYLTN